MITWYIHYNEKGDIQEVQPDTPYEGSSFPYFSLDDYSPVDQIELFAAWRKLPRDLKVVENPITRMPKLQKVEKSNSIHIKSNLIEVLPSTEDTDVELKVTDTELCLDTQFDFKGRVVVYVTERDPSFIIDTIKFTKDIVSHRCSYNNKRFFVEPYDKTFRLVSNKYSV